MAFTVQFDDATKKEIYEEAKQHAINQLSLQIMSEFNSKQIAAEVKNKVVTEAAKMLAKKYEETYKMNDVVERAVQSAESRVQSKVTNLLAKGITIRFSEGN